MSTNLEAAKEWLRYRVANGGCLHGATILSHLRALELDAQRYDGIREHLMGRKWADTPFRQPKNHEDDKYISQSGFDASCDEMRDNPVPQ